MTGRLNFKEILRSYLVILLAPFLLLGPMLARGQALFWGTPALQFVPWWWQIWQELRNGILPLWNPNSGLGSPLLANYQTAFFYPPNWLLLGMAALGGPSAVAWGYTLLAAVHLAWAGLGMALLLRRHSFRWLGQIIGGFTFGLSGYIVGRLGFFSMVWAAAWLPWIIYCVDQITGCAASSNSRQSCRIYLSLSLTGCLAMQLLAGHAQLTWYTCLLAAMWAAVNGLRAGGLNYVLRAWINLVLAGSLAAGIAALQLFPTFELLRLSPRADAFAYEEALTYSFWPWRFLTLFAPDLFGSPGLGNYWGYASYWEDHLYIGVTPLLLALATLVLLVRRLRSKRPDFDWQLIGFVWLLLIAAFILALGKNTPVFPFFYRWVPTFDMFQAPARFLIWASFALSILAATGSGVWRCPTGRGLYWLRLGTAGAFAVTIGAGLAWLLLRDIQLTFIRATALAGFWGLGFGLLTLAIPFAENRRVIIQWQWGVLIWILADLLVSGWGLNPGVSLEFYSSVDLHRQPSLKMTEGQRIYLSQTEEYDLKFRRFLRFMDFHPLEDWKAMRAALIPNLNLLEGIPSANNFDPLVTERYSRWLAKLETLPRSVRRGWLARMNVGLEEHIDGREAGGVRFDPVNGAQRIYWYGCAQIAAGYEEAWTILETELDTPPSSDRAVIIETPKGDFRACVAGEKPEIRLAEDLPDRVIVEVNNLQGGWLVLADSWYPGWAAKIDGRKTEIYPADTLFRAVYVEPGFHRVEFLYRPTGFYFAALFSILVLLSIVIYCLLRRRGKRTASFG